MRRTQKNGRERGNEGNGLGHWGEWNGGRATRTKSKGDKREREARREKSRGFSD
jgi:hypothetical protein